MDNWKLIFLYTILLNGCVCQVHDTNFDQTFDSPPKVSDTSFSFNLPIQTGFLHFSPFKPKTVPIQIRRRKRFSSPSSSSSSSSSSGVVEDVCPSISDWVAKVKFEKQNSLISFSL